MTFRTDRSYYFDRVGNVAFGSIFKSYGFVSFQDGFYPCYGFIWRYALEEYSILGTPYSKNKEKDKRMKENLNLHMLTWYQL
jgi:hypothetical protein